MRYKVAGHVFNVRVGEELKSLMDNYESFAVPDGNSSAEQLDCIFLLSASEKYDDVPFVEETRQVDDGQDIVCGKTSEGLPVFEFYLGDVKTGTLICSADFHENELRFSRLAVAEERAVYYKKFALNNSLMVLFALSTAGMDTALFHSAVIAKKGLGYMFLGQSGTGKSTHARMWLKRFDDAELLNDDNPVVRIEPDGVWVYGSPWSGKTPCYKNSRVKIAGIINLSQAPQNKIRRISGIEAYMALVASISGMRWNRRIADGLHATENYLAQKVKMFHLACLPNEEAAEMCHGAFGDILEAR